MFKIRIKEYEMDKVQVVCDFKCDESLCFFIFFFHVILFIT